MCEGIHLHVHSEESVLDGLSKVKDLVMKAKSLGQTALGLTDHGVCGAIPDFISECIKQKIKPIPGCEVYTTMDRSIRSEELEQMRKDLCIKYKITDNKGKPRMKVLRDFLRKVEKNYACFEEEAHVILKDYLMSSDPSEESLDLFSEIEISFENPSIPVTPQGKIGDFKNEIFNYLDHGNFHMVLLAINNKGLEDLYAIVSDAHINGFYSDPRTDLSFIRTNGLGHNIIATSACLGSFFSQLCLAGRLDEAKAHIQEAKDTFHTFYLEKQATLIPEQLYINNIIDQLAEETNTPKILTTDVHYANKEDNNIHDIVVASSMGKCISDENRYHYAHEYWMKSDQEMMEKCYDPEAWANTLRIAELVDVSLPSEPLFPTFPVNEGDTVEAVLRKKAWAGLFEIFLNDPSLNVDEYSRRIQYELDVICSEGFQDYFLIEEDMIDATVKAGYLVGPGRGSGAGSLVCYALKITWLDPIKNDLLFERFLNPERVGYPDLDVDYSYAGSQWVQQYLKGKYGNDRVAQIGTKGTLAARAVCRKVGKTLGYDNPTQDAFAKAIPGKPGIKLAKAFTEEAMVRQYAEMYPEWWEAMLALEGHISQVGVHAGGIVLSPEPLTKVTPLRTDSNDLETTQYDMDWIEKFLVKFDILKLDTLDLVKKTLEYSGLWGKINIYRDLDLNDPAIYSDVYQKLNLSGIFQCESDLFRGIIRDMKPTSFEDISVIVALGRPGPLDLIPSYVARKWGREKVTYPFAELQPVLKETYGVWVYQEQIMQASRILGGLTLGQADMIRKGVSKKKADLMGRWINLMIYGDVEYKRMQVELMSQYPEKGMIPLDEKGDPSIWVDYESYNAETQEWSGIPEIQGAIARGFDFDTLLKIQKQWMKFGEYCFNKAHSAAYAMLSCITAWLKCYYPVEFMAALLTMSEGKKDKHGNPKNIHYMRECEEMNISILPPDVNRSMSGWTPTSYPSPVLDDHNEQWIGEIRYGLSSVGGVSGESVNEIVNNRPYQSVEELISKTNGVKVNKTKIVALIKSGAFDIINKNRNLLLRNYYQSRGDEYEDIPTQTSKATILAYERDVFGTAISIRSRWEKIEDGANTQITGFIRAVEPWKAKTGKEHFTVTIETQEEPVQATVWGFMMSQQKQSLQLGNKVTLKGEKSRDKLTVKSVVNLSTYEVDLTGAAS
jgi:DNA polymerase III subunit alpha